MGGGGGGGGGGGPLAPLLYSLLPSIWVSIDRNRRRLTSLKIIDIL